VKLIYHSFSDRRTKRKTASCSFTAQNESTAIHFALANELKGNSKSGIDIYDQLDKYFAEAAREIALGAPLDDITLIQYLIPSFNRYHAGVQSANRLLNYINRHYVKRAVEEDRGWLRFSDILHTLAKNTSTEDSREVISKILKEKRLQELQKWGYAEGDPTDKMAFAESCAEAASPTDRVVPIASLAHRRFRTEVMEPLLASPKIKGKSKAKHKIPKPPTGPNPALPRGRLARAVKELLERDAIDEEKRLILASGLAKALQITGIRNDHVLRKKLDKYIAPGNEKT
jgi:hypothetical protein